MGLIDEYARRANWAFRRLQQSEYPEKVTQGDLGDRVGKRVRRTYTQTAVAGWLSKSLPRDLETQEALASELDVDPGWLYFNRGTPPAGWEVAEEPRVGKSASRPISSKDLKSGSKRRA